METNERFVILLIHIWIDYKPTLP